MNGGSDTPVLTGDEHGTNPLPGQTGDADHQHEVPDLQLLDLAEQEADGAPGVDVVSQCQLQLVLTSEVSAVVTVTRSPVWVGGLGPAVPASVMLTIHETQPSMPYCGCGVASVTGGASLFADPECTVPLPGVLSASALRATIPVFVRRDTAGDSRVTLWLTPDPQPNVRVVVPVASQTVTFRPVNVVTPTVAVEEAEGWYHASQFKAAKVRLGISETAEPAYSGQGRPRTAGGATLFTDEACKHAAAASFSADALRGTVLLYVKGVSVASETVTLALDPVADTHIRVGPDVDGKVTFNPVNLVTPTITVQEATGWYHPKQFKPAQIQLGIKETEGTPYAGRGTPKLSHGAKLFTDERCELAAEASFSAEALRGGLSLYVKGVNAASPGIELTLEPIKDHRVIVGPKAKDTVTFKAVAVVTPTVTVEEATGWHGSEGFKAARVRLGIKEVPGDPPYLGDGKPTVPKGAALFSDEECKQAIASLTAGALREGVTAYVKLTKTQPLAKPEKVKVALTLDASVDARIRVDPQVSRDLTFQALNVVSPKITVKEATAYGYGTSVQAARVFVTFEESIGTPAYSGNGLVTSEGSAEIFTDKECTRPVGRLAAKTLRGGASLWVKGADAGTVPITLELESVPDEPGIFVTSPKTASVTVLIVSLITPSIRCDELVLVHGSHHSKTTTLSRLALEVTESLPSQRCPDLKVRLTYGGQIACFRDEACKTAVPSGTTLAANALPPTLYMRGAAAGTCNVEAKAEGTAGPKWRFEAPAKQAVHVEELELQADTYAAGLSLKAEALCTAPKSRELHATRADRAFTLARLTIGAPTATFWEKADQVILTHAELDVFSDAPGTRAVTDPLKQGDFKGVLQRYVATQGDPDWDAEPGGKKRPGVITPVKVVAAKYVSCGARIRGEASFDGATRTLQYGDIVRLDTFSFDQYLDRWTRNECKGRIDGGPAETDVALALAAAHKYYDRTTAFWVNRNYDSVGGSPFGAFIKSMAPHHRTHNLRAADGASFVETFLKNGHGITLTALMKGRIKNHIVAVISGARTIPHANRNAKDEPRNYFGFAALYGVPGVHAECLAANDLISKGVAIADITIATYMLQDQHGRQGRRFVACPNCSGILVAPGGFRVITH